MKQEKKWNKKRVFMKPGKTNKEDRLNFVDYWAEYVRTHSDEEWSRQQNVLIDSQINPQDARWPTKMSILILLSSTIRTRLPLKVSGISRSCCFLACFSNGISNQKIEPELIWLVTPMRPCISSVSFLQIARPNPVPP